MSRDALSPGWWEPIAATLGAAALLTAVSVAGPVLLRIGAPAEVVDWSQAVQVDISTIDPGSVRTVVFRGRPVHVFHRTAEQVATARLGDGAALSYPERDDDRLRRTLNGEKNPAFLIIYASERGRCVTTLNAEGFMDPCRGSRFDFSGRAIGGPADGNLAVPAHTYVSDTTVFIGVD